LHYHEESGGNKENRCTKYQKAIKKLHRYGQLLQGHVATEIKPHSVKDNWNWTSECQNAFEDMKR
jgi:hypothetical protein